MFQYCVYEGRSDNIPADFFCSFSKTVKDFSKNLFQSIPHLHCTSVHFCYLHWSFCIPSANPEVDLPLRYRFTAGIKAALVSFLLLESLFVQVLKQINVAGAKSGLYGGWDNNCVLINSTAAVGEGALSCKRRAKLLILLQISVPPA